MTVRSRSHAAGFTVYVVEAGESTFELSAFGGQLLSWTKAGAAVLFANREHAVFDGKAPYRGGAPICFPFFGKGALMPGAPALAPQHGGARTSVWDAEVKEDAIVFRTRQATPEGFGPTELSCELAYVFRDDLRIEATVSNVGDSEAPFQLAVHSYWATENPGAATVSGMGARFLDNLAGYAESQDPASSAPHQPAFDRVYPDSESRLELTTEAYRLSIATENCAASVLWNPGPAHTIADLGVPNFVCVESGVIYPAAVVPQGGAYRLAIEYQVSL